MRKRRILELQKEIYKIIKQNPNITMSTLERKIKTNPSSLREHCKILEYWNIIKIRKTDRTQILSIKF